MSDVPDRRSLRSRRLLSEALLALLQDHDWGDISVQMICGKADVARSTFYAHFQTKQDVLDESFIAGAAEVERQMLALPPDPSRLATLDWLADHAAGSQGFLSRVQGTAAGSVIQARFRQMTSTLIRRDLERQSMPVTDGDMTFLTGGVFAAIDDWVGKGCKESRKTLTRRLRAQIDAVLSAKTQTPS